MFRSVDGCASSSGRRRDADQEKDEERLYENRKLKAQETPLLAYKTSAKPPKKAPAIARKPTVCPISNPTLPAPESAAALAELSSAELLSPVADAPPKPE